jgi:hypothetical protein
MSQAHRPGSSPGGKTVRIAASKLPVLERQDHEEWLLDDALGETFPASDPIAVTPPAAGRARPVR